MHSLDQEANKEEEKEKLDQDHSKPFSPPSGIQDDVPADHPGLDTDRDEHEWYDEGREGASGTKDLEEKPREI